MFINKKKLQSVVNAQVLTLLILLLNAALPTQYVWGQSLSVINSTSDTLMHVQEAGRVGIGTTNPKAKLSVSFSNSDMLNFYSPADNTLAIQTTIDDRDLATTDQQLENRLVLQPLVGNVGIGTTTPIAKLHVVDGTIFIDADSTGTDGLAVQNGAGNVFWINSPAGNRMDIGGRGNLDSPPTSGAISILDNDNVGIGTTNPNSKLEVSGTAQLRGNADSTGLFVDALGRVGIGTTAPTSTLDLDGTLRTTGNALFQGDFVDHFKPGGSRVILRAATINPTIELRPLGAGTQGFIQFYNPAGAVVHTIQGSVNLGLHIKSGSGLPISLQAGGSEVMRVTASGNVGIGAAIPNSKLEVSGTAQLRGNADSTGLFVDALGRVGIGTTSPVSLLANTEVNNLSLSDSSAIGVSASGIAWSASGPGYVMTLNNTAASGFFRNGLFIDSNGSDPNDVLLNLESANINRFLVRGNGNVTGFHGNYHGPSDIRMKKDIVRIANPLEKILALRGVNFRWKDGLDNGTLQMGLIAQEVEKVVPEVVHTADDEMKTKAVEYPYLTALLIEGLKQQQKVIEEQKTELQELKTKMSAFDDIRARMVQLELRVKSMISDN